MSIEARVYERHVSEGLESILGHQFPVLDEGFVRPADYMGSDSLVVQEARVSYGAGTRKFTKTAA